MDEKLASLARRIQRESRFPMPITTAFRVARYENRLPPTGYEFLGRLNEHPADITETVDDIEIHVRVVLDEDSRIGEDDVTGFFTDDYTEGCVKNNGGERHSLEWYHPANDTLENTYNELRNAGLTKAAARERYDEIVQQEMDTDRERTYLGVIVTLSLDGQELADNSLWSIDAPANNNNVPYLIDVAHELILEGMAQAEQDAPNLAARLRARAETITERFPTEDDASE